MYPWGTPFFLQTMDAQKDSSWETVLNGVSDGNRKATVLFDLGSPTQYCLKFSTVFGQTSANSSILMRPAGCPPMPTSACKPSPDHTRAWQDTASAAHPEARVPHPSMRSLCLGLSRMSARAGRTKEDHWIVGIAGPQVPQCLICSHAALLTLTRDRGLVG